MDINRVIMCECGMLCVLLVTIFSSHFTTAQQQAHQQALPKGFRNTPSPHIGGMNRVGGNVHPKYPSANQNTGNNIPVYNINNADKVFKPSFQEVGNQGQQVYKQPLNPDKTAQINFNQPNNPQDNAVKFVNNLNVNQKSDNQNLLVNQNNLQRNSKRVNMTKNAFRVPANTNNRDFRNVDGIQGNVVNTINNNLPQGLEHKVADSNHNARNAIPIKNNPVPIELFDKHNPSIDNDGIAITPKRINIEDTNRNTGDGAPGNIKVINGEIEKDKPADAGADLDQADEEEEEEEEDEDDGADLDQADEEEEEEEEDEDDGADLDQADEDEEEEEEDEDEEYEGEDETGDTNMNQRPGDRPDIRHVDLNNAINVNGDSLNNQVINDNVFHPMNNDQRYQGMGNEIPNMDNTIYRQQNKDGSLKVVWDWSDFAVNFEQFVMPEQKIRRAPHATTGDPWPLPQYYVSKSDKVYRIDKSTFKFKLSKIKCDVIEKAIERYKDYILEDAVEDMYDNFQHAQGTMFEDPSQKYETPLYLEAPVVSLVFVKIRKPCARYPATNMDESYDLFVKRTGIHIMANEVWGALRGLETLSQLVYKGTNQLLYIRDTVINDYPRFTHRGVMIDSSRHFMFKETIYDVLEGMAQNKMNVLHWHLVDDQSFPFYSSAFPDLSAKGAFHPTFVYMPEDIADIIEFARLRGIRVEPEFDTPGHTYSWGLSRPDILTQCYQGERPVEGYLGPVDPSKNETFRFLKTFFKDVMATFKDEFLHLGGDEVPMTCWQSNPEVMKFLAKLEGRKAESPASDPYYYSYDIRKVLEYYVTRLIGDLKSLATKRQNGVRFVFWQEIMNNNVQLPNDTIIHVWQGGMEDVQRATSLGLNVIYSTCWYLDQIEYGVKWSKYYQCDPADMTYGYTIDESKVLGGEACLWAEYIENENAMTLLFPRASAAAERLWSHKDVKDLDAAAARLQEHRCRMLSRGLGVGQISGPDYCLKRGKRRWQFNETNSNCTHCGSYSENSRVEVEKIKVEFEQKGGHISDCSQAVIQAGSQLTIILLIIIVIIIGVTLKVTKQKINQVRVCRNKTILLVFVTLILVYFMCYTSIWMQAMQFKGSFEKRVSSNVQKNT